jgi:hypothetical protein
MNQITLFPRNGLPRALREGFDAFWKAYPPRRPNPRALAEAAFTRSVQDGATPEQLISAAAAYAAECREKQIAEAFIVHASTFLRQQRWKDYLDAPPATRDAGQPAEPKHELWPLLRPHLDRASFTVWIGRCQVMESGPELLHLMAPSGFVARHIEQEWGALLKRVTGARELVVGEAMP